MSSLLMFNSQIPLPHPPRPPAFIHWKKGEGKRNKVYSTEAQVCGAVLLGLADLGLVRRTEIVTQCWNSARNFKLNLL